VLDQAQTTMSSEPWLGVFPGAFIFLTVLCCNVLGTALTDEGTPGRASAGRRSWRPALLGGVRPATPAEPLR